MDMQLTMFGRDHRPTDLDRDGPLLSVSEIRKTYGSGAGAVTALDGVSFDVERGAIVGLLGHNGAGKTTLIKTILALITPTDGTVSLGGVPVGDHPDVVSEHAAAVLEGARNIYWRLTVRENLNYFARIAGIPPSDRADRHDRLLRQLDLMDREDTAVNALSRGMKQKVSLAAMLAREPDLLFLDEPTLGLDVESSLTLRREIDRIVEREEMTVIVSSHDMDVIEDLCDRIIILNDGAVAVDDSIDALGTLFERRTVELTFDSTLEPTVRERLQSTCPVESWSHRHGHTRCSLRLDSVQELRPVLDVIEQTDYRLDSVQTTDVDLQDIYLQATDNDEPDRNQRSEQYPHA